MANLNPNFKRLKREYIFPIIEQKLDDLKKELPNAQILNFGIGDIALPLAPAIAKAISDATLEMTTAAGMKGYGPSSGYAFLREAIATHEFSNLGISPDEIFISDGANSDTVNILELFGMSNVIGITDPTYPAYLDASILQGQKKIVLFPCHAENNFAPLPPQGHCDLIFLCSPNNPTGVAMTRSQLQGWVDYALREKALLLIDNAYEAFIRSPMFQEASLKSRVQRSVQLNSAVFPSLQGLQGCAAPMRFCLRPLKQNLMEKWFPSTLFGQGAKPPNSTEWPTRSKKGLKLSILPKESWKREPKSTITLKWQED